MSDTLTYANRALYKLPSGAVEQIRLNGQSEAFYDLMGKKIVHAPLSNPSRILDVGCGTGIVTATLANMYPSATVLGIDLSPVTSPPEASGDVTFIQGDIRSLAGVDPRLSHGSFDYIFSRMLVAGMKDWPGYIRLLASLLKPGGCLEVQEVGFDHYDEHEERCDLNWEWPKAMKARGTDIGLDIDCGINAPGYMRAAELEVVEKRCYFWPNGVWRAETHPESWKAGKEHESRTQYMAQVMLRNILEGGYDENDIRRMLKEMERAYMLPRRNMKKMHVIVGIKRSPNEQLS